MLAYWEPPVKEEQLLTIQKFLELHPGLSDVFIAQKLGVGAPAVKAWKAGRRNQTDRTKTQLWKLHQDLLFDKA